MKLKALLFLLLAAMLPLAAPRTAHAEADVSFDYFYDALLPYGEWIEVTGYGYCWRPTEVDADWVPYSDGYWAFTDAGWTWVGYEEFAGIVYHYGRWVNVEEVGWCWVPEYEWGPGWVSWRNSDDYVGWAPLPPRAYWQPEIGISTWVDTVCDIGPAFYSFCRVQDFGAPVLRLVIVNRTRNVTIIRNTVNITNITYNTYGSVPVIYNGGPSYVVISRRCERPIPALKLVRNTHFDRQDFHGGPGHWSPNARTVGNQLIVNAPIVAPPVQAAFLKDKVKRIFAADKVTNGWAGVKDGRVREDLRGRFQRETKGLTPYTAPAKAVVVADLKVVPAQADPNAVSPVFTGKGPHGRGDRQPPAITGTPVVPGQPVNPVTDTAKPMPGNREAVTGGSLKPFNDGTDGRPPHRDQGVTTNPVTATPVPNTPADPRIVEKPAREKQRPNMDQDKSQNPVVAVPPTVDKSPVPVPNTGIAPAEPRENRGPRPMKDGPGGGFHPPDGGQPAITGDGRPSKTVEKVPGADPAAAQAQAAAEAAKAAREQANIQQQRMDAEKLRGTQAEMEKARGEQERIARQRDAEAGAAAMRQKQAADAAAANAEKEKMQIQQQQRTAQAEREKLQTDQGRMTRQREADAATAAQQKQLEAQRAADLQRQAEAAKQADVKRQQTETQAADRQRQQQEQIVEQRRQLQMDQQRAAQEAAKQQATERAREQQMDQQRAAQEAAKQQALEQRRQQQMDAQRATQDAARQQAVERAREQQMEQQRAAQEAAKQQALEQRRQQQIEQQRAGQEAAKQQAEQQRRAVDAQREQAGRQQMEAQRAAQQQAAQAAQAAQQQAAQDARRGEKEKDKEKDKGR